MMVAIHGTFEELTFVFLGQNGVAGQIKAYTEKRTPDFASPKRVIPLAKRPEEAASIKTAGSFLRR